VGVSYYIRNSSDGITGSINVSVNYYGVDRFTFALPLGKIPLKEWENGWIKTGKGKQWNSTIDNELYTLKTKLNQFYLEFQKEHKTYPTKQEFLTFIESKLDASDFFEKKKEVFDLIPIIEEIIQRRIDGDELNDGEMFRTGTLKNHAGLVNRLAAYCKHYKIKMTNISVLEKKFVANFQQFLLKVEQKKLNSASGRLRCLKSYFSVLVAEDILPFNPFEKYNISIPEEAANNIALDEEELKEMEQLDLKDNPRLDRIRDQFLLMCWSGVRISDLTSFCDIDKDGLEVVVIVNKKTGNEAVIPLFPQSKKIFEKYNNDVPRISDQQINKGLKEIGVMIKGLNRKEQIKYNRGGEIKTEMVPRYTMLTNHCGRRTLITTLVNHGFDYKDIMVVSSHVTLKSFEAYIKKNKVGAAKKMLKQFNERLSILPPITPTNNP
jgi:site-specific recombinase XerD